jgi:hypothetical protein
MREFDPRGADVSMGRGATPGDLRDAPQRYKELQEELRQIELAPETKHGEDRLERYERELRLRSMREDFQANAEAQIPQPRNTAMLAVIMTVASFLLCAACAGGTFFGLQLLTQAPDAQTTANGFWSSVTAADYATAHDTYLSPSLRASEDLDQFTTIAQQADTSYGKVSSVALVQQQTAGNQVTLTYTIVRSNKLTYPVTLVLTLRQNNWTISDYGNTFSPTTAPTKTPSPAASKTP